MKWGILATGTIAKKFASTVEQMGADSIPLIQRLYVPYMYSAQAMSNMGPDHVQWIALMNALQKYGAGRVSWDIFL